jgi:hypothetical protein
MPATGMFNGGIWVRSGARAPSSTAKMTSRRCRRSVSDGETITDAPVTLTPKRGP